jgi:hypothetical protein
MSLFRDYGKQYTETSSHQNLDAYKPRQNLAPQQPIPVSVARAAAKKARIADRIVDPRLKGADLYVARHAWRRPQPAVGRRSQSGDDDLSASSLSANLSDLSIGETGALLTRSLHDELSC